MSNQCVTKKHLTDTLCVRQLGLIEYGSTWRAMQHYTAQRDDASFDELWLLQHLPVFTQGQAGKAEHVLSSGDIPIVQSDRGGQVTYHGPGQLVGYLLVDLKRKGVGVRDLVTVIEQAIVGVLAAYHISAAPRADAPGVYLRSEAGEKIAQLGLRVKRGCSFHGLSLNVDMDMEPFTRINPCGHIGLEVTNMALQLDTRPELSQVSSKLVEQLSLLLGYNDIRFESGALPL